MPPIDPQTKKWTSLIWRRTVALGAAVVVIVLLSIELSGAVRAEHHAKSAASSARAEARSSRAEARASRKAANDARAIATCINGVLAKRNRPTLDETAAQVAYARANAVYAKDNAAFVTSLVNVLIAPKDQQQQKYALFLAVVKRYEAAAVADAAAAADYIDALQAVEKERSANPLGEC